MLYPLIFEPILKERIWGGRELERLYQKKIPPHQRIGESWEISDRPGDVSVINNGPLAGKTLRWLMEHRSVELLGVRQPMPERFPLLIKIIEAREKLSLQVHPPAAVAGQLGGEPKTEMWYVTQAEPGAEFFAGLRAGVTRGQFEEKLGQGTVAECFHRIPVRAGDAIFVPSGRAHGLGAGTTIFEVQQNSDTTYRVFDWNREDAAGKRRELHVREAMASIDFDDFEPALLSQEYTQTGNGKLRPLVKNASFTVAVRTLEQYDPFAWPGGRMQIVGMIAGHLRVFDGEQNIVLGPGQFCLLPARAGRVAMQAEGACTFLEIEG